MRRILFTATKWIPEYERSVKKTMLSAKKKYGDDLLIVVGYTAPSIKMAYLAAELGISVHAYVPTVKDIATSYLDSSETITVTGVQNIKYMKEVVGAIDAVVALHEGDPFLYHATSAKIPHMMINQ